VLRGPTAGSQVSRRHCPGRPTPARPYGWRRRTVHGHRTNPGTQQRSCTARAQRTSLNKGDSRCPASLGRWAVAGHREDPSDRSTTDYARPPAGSRAKLIAVVAAGVFLFLGNALVLAALVLIFFGEIGPTTQSGTPVYPAGPENSASARPSPSAPPARNAELEAFTRACERHADRWVRGQVDYPRTLSARMGQATTYSTAVDIRDAPAPPGKEIDSPDPATGSVHVQCVVGARLVPVSSGIDVEIPADARADGWRYLEFTPSGVLEWSWSVTPSTPASQELLLQLKPAAKSAELIPGGSTTTTADYKTPVNVTATRIDRLAYWFQTQWVLLSKVAGTVGVAILATLAFSAKARDAIKSLFTRKSTTPTRKRAATASTSTKTPSTKTKQTKKRSQKTNGERS